MEQPPPLLLDEAISLLCSVHLGGDVADGKPGDWWVEMGAIPHNPWDRDRYVDAWATLHERMLAYRRGVEAGEAK